MLTTRKQKIEMAFDKGAINYDWSAFIQRETAEKLVGFLPAEPPQNILEIGCGTGFLTKMLVQKYPEAHITAIDISSKMIEKCRAKLPFVTFEKADGETFNSTQKFDLIVSNMTVQWFENPVYGIERLKEFLTPNGNLFFTTLGQKNFWQWQEILKNLGYQSGLLKSPEYRYIFKEEQESVIYQKGMDFIKSLKQIGAVNSDEKPLTPSQLKKSCEALENKYYGNITWHLLYGHSQNYHPRSHLVIPA